MKVFSNLAVSLDGRIADRENPSTPLGTPLDRQTMQVIRKKCDVILVGSGTLKAHPKTMKIKGRLPATKKQPANAIISASAEFDPSWEFWQDPQVVRLVFTTQESLSKAVKNCGDRALVFAAGQNGRVDLNLVFRKLKELNFKNVLVEGGGETMAEVMSVGLLQELYVTLTPWVLGGRGNPSLLMGDQALWQKLVLLKSKKIKNELYLHYKVKGARRV
jgi:riboflavin-specific deaminase-like protein